MNDRQNMVYSQLVDQYGPPRRAGMLNEIVFMFWNNVSSPLGSRIMFIDEYGKRLFPSIIEDKVKFTNG